MFGPTHGCGWLGQATLLPKSKKSAFEKMLTDFFGVVGGNLTGLSGRKYMCNRKEESGKHAKFKFQVNSCLFGFYM